MTGEGLPADFAAFEAFLAALFTPTDIIQFEGYPKPNPGKGPAGRFTLEARNARAVFDRMVVLNGPPTWANWYARTNPLKVGQDPNRSATEESVRGVRALHLDIDDATPEEAIVRLDRIGWPEPHIVVRSGGTAREGKGSQVWYLLAEPVELVRPTQRDWIKRVIRTMLQVVGGDAGTENVSRLMRIPGFWNVKYPDKYKPRRAELFACNLESERVTVEEFAKLLEVPPESELPQTAARPAAESGPADESEVKPIVDNIILKCAWLKHCRDDAATLPEPEWYRMASLLSRCENGHEIFHEWSKAYAGYTEKETDDKYDHAKGASAPFSCEAISEINGAYCKDCAARQAADAGNEPAFKSPIAHGYPHRRRGPRQEQPPDLETAKLALVELIKKIEAEEEKALIAAIEDAELLRTLALLVKHEPNVFTGRMMSLEQTGKVKAKFLTQFRECVGHEVEALRKKDAERAQSLQRRGTPAKESLADAPVTENAIVPNGWALAPGGIFEVRHRKNSDEEYSERRSLTPAVVCGRQRDVENGSLSLAIGFKYHNAWIYRVMPREETKLPTEIIRALGAMGMDIHLQNKAAVIQYLAAFEHGNDDVLPYIDSVAHMGWAPGKRFVCGPQVIDAQGIRPLATADPETWTAGALAFQSPEAEDREIVDMYRQVGTLEGWLRSIAPLADYPAVQVAIYAALAAPLLSIFSVDSFVCEWADKSSSGKTTTLMVGGSVAGNVNTRTYASLIRPWHATPVWIDRALAIGRHMPLCLDDTRKVPKAADVTQTLYTITGNQGKPRGAQRGVQTTGMWDTVVLSTGENKITDFAGEQMGAHPRAVCIWGPPFGEKSKTTAKIVNELKAGLEENYGHALPAMLAYLARNRDKIPALKTRYRQSREGFVEAYCDKAGESKIEFADRMAAYAAAMQVTAELVHEAISMPWDVPDLWEVLGPAMVAGVEAADTALEALALAYEDAVTKQKAYFALAEQTTLSYGVPETPEPPITGWRGRWDKNRPYWEFIGFTTKTLTEIFRDHQMTVRSVTRWWKGRGWLMTDQRGADTYQQNVDIAGKKMRMYVVSRAAIDELLGDQLPEKDPQTPAETSNIG